MISDEEPEEEPELTLPRWLWVLVNAADNVFCMWCGSEPLNADGDHREGCPTINTCAQCYSNAVPEGERHPETEWFDGDWKTWGTQLDAHFVAAHPGLNRYAGPRLK